MDDVQTALDLLCSRLPGAAVTLLGYSFGVRVGFEAAAADPRVRRLVGIGMPVGLGPFDFLKKIEKPLLVLQGSEDSFGPLPSVRRLVQEIARRFPGAELVCDAYSPVVVRYHPHPPDMPRTRWGLKDDHDVETWAPGNCLLSQWNYFDEPEPRLGVLQLMRYFPSLARMVRIVHYRLGEAS